MTTDAEEGVTPKQHIAKYWPSEYKPTKVKLSKVIDVLAPTLPDQNLARAINAVPPSAVDKLLTFDSALADAMSTASEKELTEPPPKRRVHGARLAHLLCSHLAPALAAVCAHTLTRANATFVHVPGYPVTHPTEGSGALRVRRNRASPMHIFLLACAAARP